MDPGAFTVGAPDTAQLLARSQAPKTLARGKRDPMNTGGQPPPPGNGHAPGLGHNAHVENPELTITLLDAHRRPGSSTSDRRQ